MEKRLFTIPPFGRMITVTVSVPVLSRIFTVADTMTVPTYVSHKRPSTSGHDARPVPRLGCRNRHDGRRTLPIQGHHPMYLRLAQDLWAGRGNGERNAAGGYEPNLLRPPGYPLFLGLNQR